MKKLLNLIKDAFKRSPQYKCSITSISTNGKYVKSFVDVFRNGKRIETMTFDDESEAMLIYNHFNLI